MEGVAQGPGRVRAGLAPEGAGRDQGRRVPRRDLALRGRLAPARPWRQHHPPEEIAGRERRGPAPGHLARGSGEAAPGVPQRTVRRHRYRRPLLADATRRRARAAGPPADTTGLAAQPGVATASRVWEKG